jgi:predicted amidohydrolase
VARTPIGNLATYICSEGFQPETARAFAFKGAEILCRSVGGAGALNKAGRYVIQFRADCAASGCYGIYANGGGGPTYGGLTRAEDGQGGSSMVVDYFGRITNQADDSREQIVFDRLPVAWFRGWREKPYLRTELYTQALEDCPGKFPANMYSDHGIPANPAEAARMVNEHARW